MATNTAITHNKETMATKSPHTSLQPFTFQILDEIEGDFCKDEVLVRLIHSWEARNFKKGNMLMGLELLLLDSKSNAVQGFISANRVFRHEQNLKPNSVYKLSHFMTTPSKKNYKVSNYKQGICFTDKTRLIPVTHGEHDIEEQKFRLRTLNDFSTIVDTNTDLFDVIGQLRLISGDNLNSPPTMEKTPPQVGGTRSKDKVLLHLLMKE